MWALRIPLKTQQRLLLDATLAIVNDSWEPDLRGQSGMVATSVGEINVNNVARGAFQSGHVGYWVDERWAGKGLSLIHI